MTRLSFPPGLLRAGFGGTMRTGGADARELGMEVPFSPLGTPYRKRARRNRGEVRTSWAQRPGDFSPENSSEYSISLKPYDRSPGSVFQVPCGSSRPPPSEKVPF